MKTVIEALREIKDIAKNNKSLEESYYIVFAECCKYKNIKKLIEELEAMSEETLGDKYGRKG